MPVGVMSEKDAMLSHAELESKYLPMMADVCVAREMCGAEIAARLNRRGIPAQVTARIIDKLREGRFIDERRYAKAFVRDKLRFNGWGQWKIFAALRGKGIPENLVREALDEIDCNDMRSKLLDVARRKAATLNLSETSGRAKLYRFLMGRGYSGEDIGWALRRLNLSENDD